MQRKQCTTHDQEQNSIESNGEGNDIEEAVALFRAYSKRKLKFTGRSKNANKCARILPLFQGFVEKHASFFVDKYNYKPTGKLAGAKGSVFALFRDQILPVTLRMLHVRSDTEQLSAIQSQRRLMKRVRRNNGVVPVRAIVHRRLGNGVK